MLQFVSLDQNVPNNFTTYSCGEVMSLSSPNFNLYVMGESSRPYRVVVVLKSQLLVHPLHLINLQLNFLTEWHNPSPVNEFHNDAIFCLFIICCAECMLKVSRLLELFYGGCVYTGTCTLVYLCWVYVVWMVYV